MRNTESVERVMPTILPNVPTDSLYKFVAIFGIILVGFGLWLPERFVAAHNQQREAYKALQLAKIRVNRKKAQSDRVSKEFITKSAALQEKLKTSKAETEALREKLKPLSAELEQISINANPSSSEDIKRLKGDVKRIEQVVRRSDSIRAEMRPLQAKIDQNIAEQRALDEEFKPLQAQLEEVLDDQKARNKELRNHIRATKELVEQASWWFEISAACLLVGVVMIVAGFWLWFVRVQVYQDAILRREAQGGGQATGD
jgi:hypothetical protein